MLPSLTLDEDYLDDSFRKWVETNVSRVLEHRRAVAQ